MTIVVVWNHQLIVPQIQAAAILQEQSCEPWKGVDGYGGAGQDLVQVLQCFMQPAGMLILPSGSPLQCGQSWGVGYGHPPRQYGYPKGRFLIQESGTVMQVAIT